MITVKNKRQLRHQSDTYVMIRNKKIDHMYMRIGDEYVRKMYFGSTEAMSILGIKHHEFHVLVRQIGIQAPVNHRSRLRITLDQLRMIMDLIDKV